jgi:hypothetical protein
MAYYQKQLLRSASLLCEGEPLGSRPGNSVLPGVTKSTDHSNLMGGEMNNADQTRVKDASNKVVYEALFTLIPIICLLIISTYKGKLAEVTSSYEWSLIACILFGQLIAKFVSMSSLVKPPANQVTMLVTFIICLGLIPSAIILVLSLINDGVPNLFLIVAQFILFGLSMLSYIYLGTNCDRITGEKKDYQGYNE